MVDELRKAELVRDRLEGLDQIARSYPEGHDKRVLIENLHLERALVGVLGGVAATLVLSGLREAWMRVGLAFETAPMQVVERMEEVGLLEGW
jgi:hypothetical protein